MDDDLWIDGPDPIADAPDSKRRRKRNGSTARGKLTESYAPVPHGLGLRLAKDTGNSVLAVLLALDRAIYEAKSNRVKLTNGLLERYGITHQSKIRGLRRLAAAGVITVGRFRPREAPVVTHRWYTQRGKFRWL